MSSGYTNRAGIRLNDTSLLDPYSGGAGCETFYYKPPANKGSVAIASPGCDLSVVNHSQVAPPEQGSSKVGTEVVHFV